MMKALVTGAFAVKHNHNKAFEFEFKRKSKTKKHFVTKIENNKKGKNERVCEN